MQLSSTFIMSIIPMSQQLVKKNALHAAPLQVDRGASIHATGMCRVQSGYELHKARLIGKEMPAIHQTTGAIHVCDFSCIKVDLEVFIYLSSHNPSEVYSS
jgi:hypothetical protein